jgi:hypothetical protein
MGYAGSYKGVIYPGPDREPRVLKYRVALVDEGSPPAPATHAIIHLVQCDPKNPPPTHLNTALDLLLNKIVNAEFRGVRVDRLRFALETESAFFEYLIEYSAEDFHERGNPTVVKGTGKSSLFTSSLATFCPRQVSRASCRNRTARVSASPGGR